MEVFGRTNINCGFKGRSREHAVIEVNVKPAKTIKWIYAWSGNLHKGGTLDVEGLQMV